MGRRRAWIGGAGQGLAAAAAALGLGGLATPAWAHGVSELARQQMFNGDLVDFVRVGAEHMLTGYDHLCFLLAVLIFLPRLLDILKFVTAFTLGHALTLLVATELGLNIEPHLVDAGIALTVVYKAFENLDGFPRLFGVRAPPLLVMVFLFGLAHGLGLSTALQQMTLPHDPDLVAKILAFNLGIELGQIAALIPMALVIRLWRGSTAWGAMTRTANGLLIAAGLVLFGLQIQALLSPASGPASAPASRPST